MDLIGFEEFSYTHKCPFFLPLSFFFPATKNCSNGISVDSAYIVFKIPEIYIHESKEKKRISKNPTFGELFQGIS